MKTILVAPLDWGLGHATQCVPIIRILQEQNGRVIIGGAGNSLTLLRQEFPHLEWVSLPAYNIRYSRSGPMALTLARQLPKLVLTARCEHALLPQLITQMGIDAIISNTRFGLWTDSLPCVYITHQLRILTPPGLGIFSPLFSYLHQFAVHRYTDLWIPDFAGDDNLSGRLAHYPTPPKHAHYIGLLSRFRPRPEAPQSWDGLILLSGPEPQRTILERIIESQLEETDKTVLMVRGLPDFRREKEVRGNLTVVNHLAADELNAAMAQTRVTVARSGYSTIMDLATVGGKAVFVPTPGQTEQGYLAKRFMRLGIALQMNQKNFNLAKAFQEYNNFRGFTFAATGDKLLRERIEELLGR
ncbi:MAG: glycosyltransferase [Calditrichota bacterium]